MRFNMSVAVLGLILAGTMPAHAQNNNTFYSQGNSNSGYSNNNYTNSYANSYSNNGYSGNSYGAGSNTFKPLYNTNAQPTIPGRNAPSYNFNGNNSNAIQPYSFGNGSNNFYNASPQQQQGYNGQNQGQFGYQQQYAGSLQQNANKGATFGQLYNGGTTATTNNGNGQLFQQQAPTQRRVTYNERNNPLTTPPRLFDPDQ